MGGQAGQTPVFLAESGYRGLVRAKVADVNDFGENACQTRRFCSFAWPQGIDFRGKCGILTPQ
jgi:hypothetical protein